MCYKHHKITNDIEEFSVERLKKFKTNHEAKHLEKELGEKLDNKENLSLNAIVNQIDKDSNYEKRLKEYLWSPKARSDFFEEVEILKNLFTDIIEGLNESYQNINLEHESIRNNVFRVIL
jgi:hypothetical protein